MFTFARSPMLSWLTPSSSPGTTCGSPNKHDKIQVAHCGLGTLCRSRELNSYISTLSSFFRVRLQFLEMLQWSRYKS